MKNKLLYFWYKYIGFFFRLLPIKNNRIVVQNFFGKGYGDSPKYIVNELLNQKENIEIIWLVKETKYSDIPKEIKQIKRGSILELYYLSTSKIWIDNSRKHNGVTKRKNQIYIQTWHGGIGLKKVEKDAGNLLSSNYIKSAKNDSKMIDYLLSNSKLLSNLYRKSFWYNGKILEIGFPRSDVLFLKNTKNIKNNLKKYKIDNDSKIILYCPTFRNESYDYLNFDCNKLINELEVKYNQNYTLLIKLHPNVKKQSLNNNSGKVINVSDYSDINELLLITDILITDYSSTAFDYLKFNKPIYLYAPDYDEYTKERGFAMEYDKLPFSISYNSNQLIKNIVNNNYKEHMEDLREFKIKLGSFDNGNASKKITKIILQIINGG